jgi:hypothetical protein
MPLKWQWFDIRPFSGIEARPLGAMVNSFLATLARCLCSRVNQLKKSPIMKIDAAWASLPVESKAPMVDLDPKQQPQQEGLH